MSDSDFMVFGTCRLPPLFTEGEIATVWRDQSDLHRQEKVEAMLEINRVRTWSLIKIFRVVFGFPFIVIGLLGFCFSLYDTLDSRNSDIEGSFFIFLRSSLVLVFGLLLAFACSEKVIDRKKRSIIHTWRVLVPLRRKVYSIPNEAIVTVISEERSVKGGASEMEVQAHVPFMLFT